MHIAVCGYWCHPSKFICGTYCTNTLSVMLLQSNTYNRCCYYYHHLHHHHHFRHCHLSRFVILLLLNTRRISAFSHTNLPHRITSFDNDDTVADHHIIIIIFILISFLSCLLPFFLDLLFGTNFGM